MRKFTEGNDKPRLVHAGVLAQAGAVSEGEATDAGATVHDIARMLVKDAREMIPGKQGDVLIGVMQRKEALDILLGTEGWTSRRLHFRPRRGSGATVKSRPSCCASPLS
ncbi:MAG: hypothetical protein R8G34_01500 [Paracoccaceae bacterium]|nr:hypothetical protein [Paracoccaceae bacterium]